MLSSYSCTTPTHLSAITVSSLSPFFYFFSKVNNPQISSANRKSANSHIFFRFADRPQVSRFVDFRFADWNTEEICGFAICRLIITNLQICDLRNEPKSFRICDLRTNKKNLRAHLCFFFPLCRGSSLPVPADGRGGRRGPN
jgi:hypothetical protein